MLTIIWSKKRHLYAPGFLALLATISFGISYFSDEHFIYWINTSYTFATILIAWLAIFGHQIAEELRKPVVELRYAHDSAVRYRDKETNKETWYLSLTIENTGKDPAKDAMVKCVSIVPSPLPSIQSSSDQPISPIPLKWAYWDAYKVMYGEAEGPARSLHRTIYSRDACGILSISKSNNAFGSAQAHFELVILPNREEWRLQENTEYTVTCRVEAENYLSDRTWTFRINWHGDFPNNGDDLIKSVQIDRLCSKPGAGG